MSCVKWDRTLRVLGLCRHSHSDYFTQLNKICMITMFKLVSNLVTLSEK